jgi:hypothetical protein
MGGRSAALYARDYNETKELGDTKSRIHRYLDPLEAAVDQRLDDGVRLIGTDAEQDGEQRALHCRHETGSVMSTPYVARSLRRLRYGIACRG